MMKKIQSGAISLRFAIFCVVVVAAVGMMVMMSMRTERNLFAETSDSVKKTVQQSLPSLPAAEIRKCKVNGQWVYSNTECHDPHSQKVEIHDNTGFEAPKVPKVPESEKQNANDVRLKQIEKLVQ